MATSALLRSAASTRSKIQDAQDAQVAFEWQSSAQTYDDYLAYRNYLDNSAAKTSDPSKLLSYQTKQRSALSSYASNEIQRQTQAVIEGRATVQDKMRSVASLYDQAVANGDMNLAQNLVSTWDSLSVQAQNEAKAAVGTNAAAFKAQVDDTVDQYKGYMTVLNDIFKQTGEGEDWTDAVNRVNAQLPANQQLDPNAGFFDNVANIADAIKSIYQQAAQLAPDEATARTYEKQLNSWATGNGIEVPSGDGGTMKISFNDLAKQAAAAQIGESLYSVTTGPNGTGYVKNKVNNYTFGRDAQGNYVAMASYSPLGQDASAGGVDAEGNPIKIDNKTVNYEKLLKDAGFNVKSNGNGSYTVYGTTKANLNVPGVEPGQGALVYIDQNGRLQYANNDNQIFNLNFGSDGAYTGVSQTTPNPLNQLEGESARFNNPYFANLPEADKQALQRARDAGAISVLDRDLAKQQELNGGINMGNVGITALRPPSFSGAGNVLQGPGLTTQDAAGGFQAPQIATAPIPQIQAPTLNPANISSKATINIATAPSTQTISTTPQSSGNFSGVSVKKPSFNISF